MVIPSPGSFCYPDRDKTPDNCGGSATPAQITFDRLPAAGLWNLGLRWRGVWDGRLELDAFAYNLLDARWFQPDGFYDLAPTGDSQPLPGAGISFLATARYRFER